MSESKKIKFAVVGCGHIGKRHIAEIKTIKGVREIVNYVIVKK